jgi:hypothetical protein
VFLREVEFRLQREIDDAAAMTEKCHGDGGLERMEIKVFGF